MKRFITDALLIICVGFSAFVMGQAYGRGNENESVSAEATDAVDMESVKISEKSLSEVIAEEIRNVAGVTAIGAEKRLGSGVIISDKGYIITNQHVVGTDGAKVTVTLYDGSVREAKTVWSDDALDIAVLWVNTAFSSHAVMGESGELRAGDDVIAIGNPLSMQFERSVTKGIVSAVGRSVAISTSSGDIYMEDLIQTDASINPGNSGGPLMNTKGEVVGINTVRVKEAEGMGFAVPINVCEGVIKSLEEKGQFETPYLGFYAYNARTAEYLMQKRISDGLFVVNLDRRGPAYEAGMRYGDIIFELNGENVTSMLDLRRKIFNLEEGEAMIFSIKRGEKEKTITLAAKKEESGTEAETST